MYTDCILLVVFSEADFLIALFVDEGFEDSLSSNIHDATFSTAVVAGEVSQRFPDFHFCGVTVLSLKNIKEEEEPLLELLNPRSDKSI